MNTHTRAPHRLSRWQRFLYFFFRKLGLTTWDIEQSRWFWYRLGITEGKKSCPPAIYGPHCEVHGITAMECMKCHPLQVAVRFPDYEPITDPLRTAPRPLQAYRLGVHPLANSQTQEHRATWRNGQVVPGLVTRSLKVPKEGR